MKKTTPKSTEQTLIAFDELIRRESVVDFIKKYREYLGIPKDGLTLDDKDKKYLTGDSVESILGSFAYTPDQIFPLPEEAQRDGTNGMRIINTCRALVGSEGYRSERIITLFRNYFFFNQIIEPHHSVTDNKDDLLQIEYLPDTLLDYGDEDLDDSFLLKCAFEHFYHVSKTHPLAIYINPEVSLNQMKDFLSKKWHLIERYRPEKRLYTGKRNKPRQEINDFIYANKNKSIAEIRRLLSLQGEFLDDGHISKILSTERKKRS